MKLTVCCPSCKSGVLNLLRTQGGWYGRCTDCQSRTAIEVEAETVIYLFRNGEFSKVARR